MRRSAKLVAGGVLALIVALAPSGGDRAQDDSRSDAYVWIQYGADGHPHARAIPSDRAACPPVSADDHAVAMTVAVVAAAGFDRVLCDAMIPRDARVIRIGGRTLPPLPRRVTRFIVLGDTGCRIKDHDIQNCNDRAAWPFARVAQAIARESPRPDLIVHVGDYQAREAPCPVADPRCAGSPFGDNWSAWAVDFFEPGAPLFATAPLVGVRGDREACNRSGLGWTRYLAPEPALACRPHESPATATFADLRVVDVDSAAGDENDPDPVLFERDERSADAQAQGRETFVVTNRPPLAYFGAHATGDPNGPHLAAIVAGHVDLFAALPFDGAPPTIIVGTGGASLATSVVPELSANSHAVIDARFGYAVFDRVPGGWSISERDPGGAQHRRCELRDRTVRCRVP